MLRSSIRRSPDDLSDVLPQLSDRLEGASSIAVLTGAGISAESGVPTFRGHEGLWKRFRPEELADFGAFVRNPLLVQSWYAHRRNILTNVKPNRGHRALARLQELVPECVIITQNIDNLHQRAGSRRVVELHGSIFKNYCVDCLKRYDGDDLPEQEETVERCECGGFIRPDVVWFGELLPEQEYLDAEQCCQSCDILMSVGTSGIVYPAAGLPLIAKKNGAFLVEVNIEPTEISSIMDLTIRRESGKALPLIVESIA